MSFATHRSRTRTRAILCAVAFALWLATTLGFMHRTLHDPSAGLTSAAAAAEGHTAMTVDARPAQSGLLALFGNHADGDADCRLYDQFSHGAAALCVPLVILPVMLPAATFVWLEGEALARWVALFDARGPPSAR